MSRIKFSPVKLLSGVTANSAGATQDISDFRFIVLTVYTTGSASATIKFGISNELTAPNFSNAQSTTNVYDYAQILPLNSQATPIVGSTGIVLTGTDIVKMYAVQTDYIHWICPVVSGYGAGTITCEITGANDFSQ